MTEHDQVFQEDGRILDFEFDARVAKVFDDMVARSVPYYDEIQTNQAGLAVEFLPEKEGLVLDLGCSTGTTIAHLSGNPRCPPSTRFMGIDSSLDMLARAKEKLAALQEAGRLDLVRADLDTGPDLPACNLVFLNWTLQFIRPLHREALVARIAQALRPGGALFLSEKVLVKDSLLNRLYIEHYLRHKKGRGYSDTEIQRKREALENVLVPYRLEENLQLLERCGFETIDTYFRWFNFACMIAVKPDVPSLARSFG